MASLVPGQSGERKRAAWLGISNPIFPEDLFFEILCLVPAKSLLRFRCVCKAWLKLIDSHDFTRAHSSKAHKTNANKTTRIFIRAISGMKPDPGCSESSPAAASDLFLFPPLESSAPIYRHVYILEIEDGKGKLELLHGITSPCNILASCDGLILLRMDAKSCLMVMNPLTRMQIFLPLGTLPSRKLPFPYDYLCSESYALTQVPSTGVHKLAHLFRNQLGYIQCETLNLSSRSWEPVTDWPIFSLHDENRMIRRPVEAIGALHWLRLSSDHTMVSYRIEDNKFFETSLPTIRKDQQFDRLLEMEGCLCCTVSYNQHKSMEIWMLNGLCGTGWTKQHNIDSDSYFLGDCTCYLSGTNELLFVAYTGDNVKVIAYDLKLKQKRMVNFQEGYEILKMNGFANADLSLQVNTYLPYADTLAMWKG